MPKTNTSKLTAFMAAAKALIVDIDGVADVIVMGQRDAEQVFARAKQKASGQVVSIQPVGGDNSNPEVVGPKMNTRFQVHIYDHPGLRLKQAPHGFELCEAVMKELHLTNTQTLKSACNDCKVTGWNLETEGSADIYVIALQVNLHFTQ